MELLLAIKNFLQTLIQIFMPQNQQSSASPPASDPEAAPVAAHTQHRQQLEQAEFEERAAAVAEEAGHNPNPSTAADNGNADNNVGDWPAKVIGFGFAWAAAVALGSLHSPAPLPLSYHFLSGAIIVAVTLLYISKYMSPDLSLSQVLERVGVLFGVTGLIFAITIPYSLHLKLIHWAIFLVPLLVIFLCNRH